MRKSIPNITNALVKILLVHKLPRIKNPKKNTPRVKPMKKRKNITIKQMTINYNLIDNQLSILKLKDSSADSPSNSEITANTLVFQNPLQSDEA